MLKRPRKRTAMFCCFGLSAFLFAASWVVVGCGGGGNGDENENNQNHDNINSNENMNENVNENSNNTNENNNHTGLTIQEYCEKDGELIQPWCDYAEDCCSADDMEAMEYSIPFCRYGSKPVSDCVDWAEGKVNEGLMVFNGETAQECLDEKGSWISDPPETCSGTVMSEYMLMDRGRPADIQIPACRQAFMGTLELGDSCNADVECGDGLVCYDLSGNYNYKCSPVQQAYDPCRMTTDCEYGLICKGPIDDKFCGELSGQGGSCRLSSECEAGLVCHGDDTCAPPIPDGGDCTGFGCGYLSYCSYDTSQCTPLKESGTSCDEAYECKGRCDTSAGQCVDICGGTK